MPKVQEPFKKQQEAMPTPAPAYEAWFRRKVEAGLRDVREGRVVSHEQIVADSKARHEAILSRQRES